MFEENNDKSYYESLTKLYESKNLAENFNGIYDINGILRKNDREVIGTWINYMTTLFNNENSTADIIWLNSKFAELAGVWNAPSNTALDEDFNVGDIEFAIKHLKNNKATGEDDIPAEAFKEIKSETLIKAITHLLNICKNKKVIPPSLLVSIIIIIHKKGATNNCNNFRTISLMNILTKILVSATAIRLTLHVESKSIDGITDRLDMNILHNSQSAYRTGKNREQPIHALYTIQVDCYNNNVEVFITFIDLKKAFDLVNRTILGYILKIIGVPELLVCLILNFHYNSTANFRYNGTVHPEIIPLSTGLKQGCVAAPILFLIFFSAIFTLVYKELGPLVGGRIRIQSKDKTFSLINIWELMFADDVAIITYSKEDTQKFINCLDKICRKFGMEISGTKTEIMHQKKRNDTYPSPKFYLGNHELKLVSNFKYLGTIFSTITSENASNYMESDINRRINQSWFAFSKFKNILKCNKLSLKQKIVEYLSRVSVHLTQALYARAYHKNEIQQLEVHYLRQLRQIYGLEKAGLKSRDELYDLCGVSSIENQYYKNVLKFVCNINNLKDTNVDGRKVIHISKSMIYYRQWFGANPIRNRIFNYDDVIKKAIWYINVKI